MDYEPNNRHTEQRNGRGWRFTFFGETSENPGEEENEVQIAPEFTQSELTMEQVFPLSTAKISDRLWVVGFRGKGGISRLLSMGLTPGIELQVVSCTPGGSVMVNVGGNRIGLGAGMAEKILVIDNSMRNRQQINTDTNRGTSYLRELPVGTRGRVVGYEKAYQGYKGKLLSMGLTPGTEFIVIRHAPLGDPVEIEVRGFKLSLRKQEADALCVEEVDDE
ncbi:ferrous iron transport protein A [Pleurocapsales cyanobacterium LEGE 06147]|nr:ferrous iron transport protein A [Pleurocapsales cyanobacterium LEGE 06147]